MPERDKKHLYALVVQAIKESGWDVLYLPEGLDRALRLQVYRNERQFGLRVYIWNLTHGGGAHRPTNEYRIQITGVDAIVTELGMKTLLLGWWEPEQVFAAFDATKHSGPFGKSPSIQISEDALRRASNSGIAPYNKGNGEIALGVRPDFFVEYSERLEILHALGESDATINVFQDVVQETPGVNDETLANLGDERRIALRAVREKVRKARFQRKVLDAYTRHCAMCRVQLELIEAAHIIPVAHPRSSDEVFNGIALCVIHHRAYDRGLVTVDVVDNEYRIALNTHEITRLRDIGHADGFERFRDGFITPLLTPSDISSRPNANLVRFGNDLRGWSELAPHEVMLL